MEEKLGIIPKEGMLNGRTECQSALEYFSTTMNGILDGVPEEYYVR
jgi:hypothetical protein